MGHSPPGACILGFPSQRYLSSWVTAGRRRKASYSTSECFSLGPGPHTVYHSLSWGSYLASLTLTVGLVRIYTSHYLSLHCFLNLFSNQNNSFKLQNKISRPVSTHTDRYIWERGSGGRHYLHNEQDPAQPTTNNYTQICLYTHFLPIALALCSQKNKESIRWPCLWLLRALAFIPKIKNQEAKCCFKFQSYVSH